MKMDEDKKKKIADELANRVGILECPICHQSRYTLIDGFFVDMLQEDYKVINLVGRKLPTILLVCNHCGHIDKFSLGVLGFMVEQKSPETRTDSKSDS